MQQLGVLTRVLSPCLALPLSPSLASTYARGMGLQSRGGACSHTLPSPFPPNTKTQNKTVGMKKLEFPKM